MCEDRTAFVVSLLQQGYSKPSKGNGSNNSAYVPSVNTAWHLLRITISKERVCLVAMWLIGHGWQPWTAAPSKYKEGKCCNRCIGDKVPARLSDSKQFEIGWSGPWLVHDLHFFFPPSYYIKPFRLLQNAFQYDHCCHINMIKSTSSSVGYFIRLVNTQIFLLQF